MHTHIAKSVHHHTSINGVTHTNGNNGNSDNANFDNENIYNANFNNAIALLKLLDLAIRKLK